MRRHLSVVVVALVVAGGTVLAWPSIAELARTPVPAGAVLPATRVAGGVAEATFAPTPSPTPTPDPTPLPTATSTPSPMRSGTVRPRPEPLVAPARAADGPAAPDPRLLRG